MIIAMLDFLDLLDFFGFIDWWRKASNSPPGTKLYKRKHVVQALAFFVVIPLAVIGLIILGLLV